MENTARENRVFKKAQFNQDMILLNNAMAKRDRAAEKLRKAELEVRVIAERMDRLAQGENMKLSRKQLRQKKQQKRNRFDVKGGPKLDTTSLLTVSENCRKFGVKSRG